MAEREKEDDRDISEKALELKPEEEKFLERKKAFRLRIHPKLRIPLIWTAFFIIIGIVIQSIESGRFVFFAFFGENYVDWFRLIGSFVRPTYYATAADLFYALMSHWYYFFYTGGLLALIWELLSIVIQYEVMMMKHLKEKKEGEISLDEFEKKYKLVTVEEEEEPEKTGKKARISEIEEPEEKMVLTVMTVEELLAEGNKLLEKGKTSAARKIYDIIQAQYPREKDPGKEKYRKIIEFYNKIIK